MLLTFANVTLIAIRQSIGFCDPRVPDTKMAAQHIRRVLVYAVTFVFFYKVQASTHLTTRARSNGTCHLNLNSSQRSTSLPRFVLSG